VQASLSVYTVRRLRDAFAVRPIWHSGGWPHAGGLLIDLSSVTEKFSML
jgi:hypothetical protein